MDHTRVCTYRSYDMRLLTAPPEPPSAFRKEGLETDRVNGDPGVEGAMNTRRDGRLCV